MRTPTFDERVLEITDPRLTSLLRGLAAEKSSIDRLKRLQKQQQDAEAAAEVRNRQDTRTDAQKQAAADAAGRRATQCYQNTPIYKDVHGADREQRTMDAAMKAAQSGDATVMKAFSDSVQRAAMAQDSLLKRAALGCGLDQYGEPLPPAGSQSIPQVYVRDSLLTAGTRASGMEWEQYVVMRERAIAFAGSSAQELRNSSWAFTSNELHVLEGKRSELARYQEILMEY
jgi:hypothetical protein